MIWSRSCWPRRRPMTRRHPRRSAAWMPLTDRRGAVTVELTRENPVSTAPGAISVSCTGFPEQLAAAQGAVQRPMCAWRRCSPLAVVGPERRDRGHGDDETVARVDQLGSSAGHPQCAQYVGLPTSSAPVPRRSASANRFEALCATGVVEQQVHRRGSRKVGQRVHRGVVCDVGQQSRFRWMSAASARCDPPAGHCRNMESLVRASTFGSHRRTQCPSWSIRSTTATRLCPCAAGRPGRSQRALASLYP